MCSEKTYIFLEIEARNLIFSKKWHLLIRSFQRRRPQNGHACSQQTQFTISGPQAQSQRRDCEAIVRTAACEALSTPQNHHTHTHTHTHTQHEPPAFLSNPSRWWAHDPQSSTLRGEQILRGLITPVHNAICVTFISRFSSPSYPLPALHLREVGRGEVASGMSK